MNKIFRVVYPTKKFILNNRQTYYDYLYRGFLLSDDVQTEKDISLDKDSYAVSEKVKDGGYFIIKTITAIDVYYKNKHVRVYYDWSDFQRFFYPELLGENTLYFKVECNPTHIVRFGVNPIGHGVTDIDIYFSHLNKLRKMAASDDKKYDVMGIFRATSPTPGIKSERITCLEKISKMKVNSFIGIEQCTLRPPPPDYLLISNKYNYVDFLEATARSKINILLPGIGELTWRISEAFGMGCCCVMPTLTTTLPGNPQNCWIEVRRDYSDLEEKINFFLEKDKERMEIERNALEYFRKWLSPAAQARNILRSVQGIVDDKRA